MELSVLEQVPAWYFARHRGPLQRTALDTARNWARRAVRTTRRRPEVEFKGRGFLIEMADLSFGRARVRARLQTHGRKLFIDLNAEADLHQELVRLGLPLHPAPRDLIVTHELFHLLCPRCPSNISEMAAHLFVAELLELPYFPGLLDVATHLDLEGGLEGRPA